MNSTEIEDDNSDTRQKKCGEELTREDGRRAATVPR